MPRRRYRRYLIALLPAVLFGFERLEAQYPVQTYAMISRGGRLHWSTPRGLIVFDNKEPDSYFDVYTMLPNGSGKVCLTCGKPPSQSHAGNPEWHPFGNSIVFQAHNASLPFLPVERQPLAHLMTSPGWGTNNNLWLMTSDGTQFWQLTSIAAGMGTLHPHFDAAGSRLLWSEKIGLVGLAEQWTLKMANLVWGGGSPQLVGTSAIQPLGVDIFYEAHGFSPDGRRIVFSAGAPAQSAMDLYTYELSTGTLQNLTNTPAEWDEHAQFTPDGSQIVWASNRNIAKVRDYFVPYLDYWIMNADGSNQQRLTYFNDPAAPEYYSTGLAAADFSFGRTVWSLVSKFELTISNPTPVRMDAVAVIQLKPGSVAKSSPSN